MARRRLARWPGEASQAARMARGVPWAAWPKAMFSPAARPCQPAWVKAALNGAPHGVWLKLPQAWMRWPLSWAARVRVRWACRAGRPARARVADTRQRMARTWLAGLVAAELSPA